MSGNPINSPEESLRRDIGVIGTSMMVLNGVVGAGIFVLPGTLRQEFGLFSPYAILIFGAFMLIVAIPIAEVASHFDRTGGPVVYAREAFGRFASFHIGWIFYVARIAA